MKIAIVGARLAGSYAALLLARAGHEVVLLDPSVDREKPCGGGVTGKALRSMPWLRNSKLPHTLIQKLRMISDSDARAELELRSPIFIFSRQTLDTAIRTEALHAGAKFFEERALKFGRDGRGWLIETPARTVSAEILIGADGATSSVRAITQGKYEAADLSLALGFYLHGVHHRDTAIAVFQEKGFYGYLWSFPRIDHSSVGILNWLPKARSRDLRLRVTHFIEQNYPDSHGEMQFYAARIPCLRVHTLDTQRVCGTNWALLGDAAGFADAITAEGIYFSLRSAELLAECVQRGGLESYEQAWRKDFGADLRRAAAWHERFFTGNFVGGPFTRRAVQLTNLCSTVHSLTDGLISGKLDYQSFRKQMILRGPRIFTEAIQARFLS